MENIIENQPTINIGTIGHVAHGKSTLVKALTEKNTGKFHDEKKKNMTIKLGYANAKIYKCPQCPRPICYTSTNSKKKKVLCKHCKTQCELKRHVSFVDCPGHNVLMSTMINGANVMNGALLLISGNEKCPQPQTYEHMVTIEIMKLKNILVIQNKIDLIKEHDAMRQYDDIKKFVKNTVAENSPIIPTAAHMGYNVDVICEYIVKNIENPKYDVDSKPHMTIVRSFDINKKGDKISKLRGGVLGGTILRGKLNVGDVVEIRPGLIRKQENKFSCIPLKTKIVSLRSDENNLEYAIPGGLIGVGTKLDPSLTKGDRLIGNIIGYPNHMPDVYSMIKIRYKLMKAIYHMQKNEIIKKINIEEKLLINSGGLTVNATAEKNRHNKMTIKLEYPICANINDVLTISRKYEGKWRLIGYGNILQGYKIDINIQVTA